MRAANVLIAVLSATTAAAQFPTLAGGPQRSAVVPGPGPSDLSPAWVFPASDASVAAVRFVGEVTPVVADRLVIAAARPAEEGGPGRLIAVDRASGLEVWSATVPAAVLDSWSSPTVDRANASVLFASGEAGSMGGLLRALRLADGATLWETRLSGDVVNATVLVTADRGPADRAFITDFAGLGSAGGRISCINVDPFDAAANPFDPGELLWSFGVGDGLSGATPAYDGERVYIATTGDFFSGAGGRVLAFDAGARSAAAAPVWTYDAGGDDGFFGGVAVAGGAVYSASFDFAADTREASRLIKLDAASGTRRWLAAADRTDSIPVPLADGRVLLSVGLFGFGSLPSVQVFEDLGDAAVRIADSAADTFVDTDGDGAIGPGEFTPLGGFTHQPVVIEQHAATGGPVMLAGSFPSSGAFFGFYERLSLIDLRVPFGAPGWIIDAIDGAGGSPAVAGRSAYSVGEAGLHAFGSFCAGDVDLSGKADVFDLLAHLRSADAGDAAADVTLDAKVDGDDAAAVVVRIDEGCGA